MIIITSGAYLNPEFTSLFGELPPTFLPVGNRRLFHWQLESFGNTDEKIVITLPNDFEIPAADKFFFEQRGVQILFMPSDLTLGASIVYTINVSLSFSEPVKILHGDTLFGSLKDIELDTVLTGETSDHYMWARCSFTETGQISLVEGLTQEPKYRKVLCGYFSFKSGAALSQCITHQKFDFISGIEYYSQKYSLVAKETNSWFDFGHIQTYYRSKANFTTERAFNELRPTPLAIEKSSLDCKKISAEADWFESIPSQILPYTPQFLGREIQPGGTTSYRLQYLYLSTLSELAVFGELPAKSWEPIFAAIADFVDETQNFKPPEMNPVVRSGDYLRKTLERLEMFAEETGLSLTEPVKFNGKSFPSLSAIAERVALLIPDASDEDMCLIHGDLCYSNILFDSRSFQIKVIDPRGLNFAGQPSIYGDSRYDLAKLNHSVVGRYDEIVAGRFDFTRNGILNFDLNLPEKASRQQIEDRFLGTQFGGRSANSLAIKAITITLFLSMLPLHRDNEGRQLAFLANAVRLFGNM
jgi:hypothetical protein